MVSPTYIVLRVGLFFLLTALLVLTVRAQQTSEYEVHPDYTIRQWTVLDGLPSNTINALTQTSDGYLWLGTNEGLVRFDGYQFTVFNAAPVRPSKTVKYSGPSRMRP